MNLLILGGTSEAQNVVKQLTGNTGGTPCKLIYSVAGLVRIPELPCEVISGGFSQYGGLSEYLVQRQIDGVIDVTHPYAQRMSAQAIEAAEANNVSYWRFERQSWQPQQQDQWQFCGDWQSLVQSTLKYHSLFISLGRLSQGQLDYLFSERASVETKSIVVRSAVEPKFAVPESISWIKQIGPFTLEDELALIHQHNIDVLLCKNSGGKLTQAKLGAARQCRLPVYMLQRPKLLKVVNVFHELEPLIKAIENWLYQRKSEKHDV